MLPVKPSRRMHFFAASASLCGAALVAVAIASTSPANVTTATIASLDDEQKPAPEQRTLPEGELGRVIELGREMIERTGEHPLSKPYVGNALTCSSCHLDAGTHPRAATFLSTATAYPAWSPREQRVITLEDRVLNCFMRSLNGIRPPNGSRVSVAMTAYITWLSEGEPLRMNATRPLGPKRVPPLAIDVAQADVERGKLIYDEQCGYCHGEQGAGSDDGPPVWGDDSYNDGAGMSRNDKLAAWLKVAMPLDDPQLSEQQALDVAAFINSHERPHFVLDEHLPPPSERGEYNSQTTGSERP